MIAFSWWTITRWCWRHTDPPRRRPRSRRRRRGRERGERRWRSRATALLMSSSWTCRCRSWTGSRRPRTPRLGSGPASSSLTSFSDRERVRDCSRRRHRICPQGCRTPRPARGDSRGGGRARRSTRGSPARCCCRRRPWRGRPSPRETEVLRLVARGLANKQIARSSGSLERTVKAHLSRVFQSWACWIVTSAGPVGPRPSHLEPCAGRGTRDRIRPLRGQ